MSDKIKEAAMAERQRCIDIIGAAREGLLDTDLRALLYFIESGKAVHELTEESP